MKISCVIIKFISETSVHHLQAIIKVNITKIKFFKPTVINM